RPIDAKNLDAGIVINAGREIRLGKTVGSHCARDFQIVDAEANRVADLARGHSGGGLEQGVVEFDIAVVIGEALPYAVAACQPPAGTKRRCPAFDMRGKSAHKGFHRRISTIGMLGMTPLRNPDRLTSSLSVSKR